MKRYIGTKVINAKPMNRLEYNEFRGWTLPADEDGADEGYLVEYVDGRNPNTQQYAGYVSWSPKEQFDNAYRETAGMTFGSAIEAMKLGLKVARAGWNGKGMYLTLIPAGNAMYQGFAMQDCIGMKTAANQMQPGWLASQNDMLSDDWVIIE